MSKTITNQLKEIIFINTASLPFAHVDVDGNTLFSGRNGAGKTTVLRAVLYFYGAYRSEALGINRKKKRFEEYYFKQANSYLIYRFSNDFGNVLAVVYRTAGVKVRYRFIKEPADIEWTESLLHEICFKDNSAKESKELFNSFLSKNFELSPVISSSKEYKNILYGQDRRLITYSFFQANAEYEQIAKTLSNIFVNSKLDSGSIKKSLAASINGFDPIDLDQMEQMIEGFRQQYEDIKNFQKQEGTIIEAIGTLSQLEEHNEAIKKSLAQLQSNKTHKERLLTNTKRELEEKQAELHECEINFQNEQQKYEEHKNIFIRSSAVLEAHIEEANQKQSYYDQEDIKKKVADFATLTALRDKSSAVEKQKSMLTQMFTSITEQFEALKSQESQSFHTQKQAVLDQINTLERAFNEKLTVLMQDQQESVQKFDQTREQTIGELRSELMDVKDIYQKASFEFDRLKNEPFLQQELQAALEARRFTQEQLQNLSSEMSIIKKDLELIFAQVSQKEQSLAQTLQANRERYLRSKEDIVKVKEPLNAKLEHYEHSLFGFIKDQDLPHAQKLLKVLKEDILFSSGLSPKRVEGDSLLGIELDFDALETADFDIASLQDQLKDLEEKEKSLTSSYEQKNAELENETRNAINALKRQEQALRQKLDRCVTEQPKLERASLEAVEAVERLQKDANGLKAQAEAQAEEKLLNAKKIYEEKQQEFKAKEEALYQERELILQSAAQEKEELEVKPKEAKAQLELDLEELVKAFNVKLESMRMEEEKALKEGGIDTKLLQGYVNELDELAQQIRHIEGFSDIVKEYEIDTKRLFSSLEDKNRELNELKETYNKQTHQFNAKKYEFDERYKESSKALGQLRRESEKLKGELSSFDTFMQSGFGKILEMAGFEEVEVNDDSLKDLIETVKEASYSKERSAAELGKKLRRIFDKLSVNSSFNIERPANEDDIEMIKAARALESFVHDNKIDTFKTEVARLYETTLHHISSETTELLKADGEIRKTVSHINQTLSDLQGIKVIEKIELKFRASDNPILNLLTAIGELTQEMPYGNDNLFSQGVDKNYHKNVMNILVDLSNALDREKNDLLSVEDSFVLEFRAIENGHDTGFVSSLDGIGSNGTDVMVKAMVYIAMLSLAREQSSKKDSEVFFHCILDEVGILAPNYLKELINYANAKQIRFLNGAPDEKLVTTYKRLYMLSTNAKHQTMVRRLLAQV